jgi:hypothetical protein
LNPVGLEVELPAPPGYGRVVALDPRLHAGLGVDAGRIRRFGRDQQLLLLTDGEFFQAALHYPIALLQPAGQALVPVAVLGMRAGRNLFVDDDGRWEPGRYLPAVVRRYPFCVVRVGAGAAAGQRLIGVDRDALVASASPLFDATGAPTPFWQQQQELIDRFEGALEASTRFCQRLEASALLEPFDVHIRRDDGRKFSIAGLQRVSEERLMALDAATAGAWLADGTLACIHAHLISLNHFPRFAERCV